MRQGSRRRDAGRSAIRACAARAPDADDATEVRICGRETETDPAERDLVDVRDPDLRGAGRTSARHDVGNGEAVEVSDEQQQDRHQRNAFQVRHRDVPEALPSVRAVDPRSAQQLVRHGLQPGQHHDHGEGKFLPDIDQDERGQDGGLIVEKVDRLVGQAELDANRSDHAEVGVEDPAPHIGGCDRADHPGNEQRATQQRAPAELAIEGERRREADDEGEECRPERPHHRIPSGLMDAVGQRDAPIVVEAGKDLLVERQVRRSVEERQVNRVVDRVSDDQQHHADGRQDIEVVVPMPPDAPQQRSALAHARLPAAQLHHRHGWPARNGGRAGLSRPPTWIRSRRRAPAWPRHRRQRTPSCARSARSASYRER
jgi:hypothetical protein